MTIPNPEHLFDQADRLLASPFPGPIRQTDLRRAISAAYYGLFHTCLIAAADEFVGAAHRATNRYGLVYRGIDHRTLREVCDEAKKPTPSARYMPHLPPGGFDSAIRAFSDTASELQRKRHLADYNPVPRLKRADAELALSTARDAVRAFARADEEHRKLFLTLLVCPPR